LQLRCRSRYGGRIDAPDTLSRSLLGALASVPLDSEAARAFLQRRVGLFAKVFAILVTCFQLVGRSANLRSPQIVQRMVGEHVLDLQLLLVTGFVAIWLRTKWGSCSHSELRWLDTIATIVPPLALALAIGRIPSSLRPDFAVVIVVGHILSGRAILIPSSARRTFVLGAVVTVAITLFTFDFYRMRNAPGVPPAWLFALISGAWMTASTAMATLASYTIYGLRQKVALAAQLGQYTLEHKLGQGGMGVVYRARHALLRRPTAIKLLTPDRAGEHDLARFEREVQLSSQLTHPNTISIYDYGRTPQGVFYYAMEFLDGIDLQQLVECAGPQPTAAVTRILEQVGGALNEAHGRGLIHRDIKPANIILCERGGVPGIAKVVDFGLVKSMQGSELSAELSVAQAIMGTPFYLSPEAIARPDHIDARADLYALGAVAYFLLTGTPVFSAGSVVEICGHHLYTVPEPPSRRATQRIPADLEALVLRLLEKDPAKRVASARELQRALIELPSREFWSDEQVNVWWTRILERRGQARGRVSASTPGSQTLAVDWNARRDP
jgi:serine/threonine protein kinase